MSYPGDLFMKIIILINLIINNTIVNNAESMSERFFSFVYLLTIITLYILMWQFIYNEYKYDSILISV